MPGRDLLIGDDAQHFAAAAIELIQRPGLAAELASNLRRLVETQFSIPALVSEGQEILDYLMSLQEHA